MNVRPLTYILTYRLLVYVSREQDVVYDTALFAVPTQREDSLFLFYAAEKMLESRLSTLFVVPGESCMSM